ncbi:hypothetical protein ACIOG7_10445 [Streptomyces sp. NPDC087894]|uniref:hypothetical protein n=1 Tax=Streptomyces sp. NPDC087894 TaxID=3365816 RepID=UPI00382364B3
MSSVDWGDAPTWIAAIFAGGAALFAGMTIRSQRQQIDEQRAFIGEQSANLLLERELLRAQADDRKRAQARSITMSASMAFTIDDADFPDVWQVTVSNPTEEPMTDVWVRFGDTYTALSARTVTARGVPRNSTRGVPVDVIGPNRRFRFDSSSRPGAALENDPPVLLFRDTAGTRSRLDQRGVIQEIDDDVTG